ncbi:MAG: polysaccharide deacetylase family protein [Oscillospiraceae bacterium]|nr:polysaccharide deacetylase family protein [Oscillospiraceae bacterium]
MRLLAFILSVILLIGAFFISYTLKMKAEPASADMDMAESPPAVSHSAVSLPALMYHSVLKNPSRTGEYVITPSLLENDLKYLRDKGYTAVSPEEILAFTDEGEPLPEKPVFITFDDGHLNNMTYALPLLEEYDMKAVVNITGAFTVQSEKENDPNPAYAYLTRENAAELSSGDVFSVGCHTYNMHSLNGRRGAAKNNGESKDEYLRVFAEDTDKWLDIFGNGHTVYAYPYGAMSREGFDVLKERGFRIILTCRETGNLVYSDGSMKDKLVIIDRYNRTGLVQTDEFMSACGIK